jgi:surface antigen
MKKHSRIWYSLVLPIIIIAGLSISPNFKAEAQSGSLIPDLTSTAYNSDSIFTACGYKGQCTWFTYGRALEKLNIKLPTEFYGNAINWWSNNINDKVYNYGSEPKADSIIVWGGGSSGNGHVGYVEKVEGDLVYFNEANFSIRGNYQGYLEVLSKEAIKNRGNCFLKGYIYVKEKYSALNNNIILYGRVKLANTSSVLSVRSGAGTSFSILGSLPNNTDVTIIEKSESWYKIKYNNSIAYIASKYVTIPQTAAPVTKSGTVKLLYKTSTLNVRFSPNGAIISTLNNGNVVNIVGQSGDFYKITFGKITGYASVKYISQLK